MNKEDKYRLKSLIKSKQWNDKLQKSGGCISEDGYYKFVAFVTWSGLDFCAGGDTNLDSMDKLYYYLTK